MLLYKKIKDISSYELHVKIFRLQQLDEIESDSLWKQGRYDEGYNYRSKTTQLLIEIFKEYGSSSYKSFGTRYSNQFQEILKKGHFYIFNGMIMIESLDNGVYYYEFNQFKQ